MRSAEMNVVRLIKTIFVDVDQYGAEIPGEVGMRLLVRYPWSGPEDRSFEFVDTTGFTDFLAMSDVEMLNYIHGEDDRISDYLRFAEENHAGITIGHRARSWDALIAEGYEYLSTAMRQNQGAVL